MSVKVETTILGNIVFVFFRVAYTFQKYLSKLFFALFIWPALLLSKLFNTEKNLPDEEKRAAEDKSFVVLDTLFWHNDILVKYLNLAFKVNSFISGVKHRFSLFELVLNWNQQIPLIGFEEDKTTFTIETLHGKEEHGRRACNFIWLTTHNISGKFKIVSKVISEDKDEIKIKAIWLTGEDRGKAFDIGRSFPYKDSLKGLYDKPSSIYYPPKMIVFIIELFLSASAVLALFELTKNGWKWAIPMFNSIYLKIIHFLDYISSLWGN